jgi:hypothetical protein
MLVNFLQSWLFQFLMAMRSQRGGRSLIGQFEIKIGTNWRNDVLADVKSNEAYRSTIKIEPDG